MNYKEYIEKRIENLKASNLAFKRLSLLLFVIGFFLIFLPFFNWIPSDLSNKYAQYGFGFINMLIPFFLEGLISKRKSQILDLELIKGHLSDATIEENIIKKILERL
ncbi:hypothetical protein ACFS7Z_22690 [Pontibacter toksunensis]|uniref:Uncharacterized protein n=1 Tax=Pontibacter toksunensis TaxID=1332631 RepID=A0ABW6C233_9BACT